MSYVALVVGWFCRIAGILYRCFLEARPAVQGIFLLRFLAGASFAGTLSTGGAFTLWGGAALCICATLSVYILNGVMDVEEDQVNGSSRPVARGKLTVAQAAGVASGLAVLSIAGGFALENTMAWSIIAALGLGWLYSGPPFYLKRWPTGLAVVAILAGLITYNAGYAANGGDGDGQISFLLFAAVMAVWMGLVGQTKDLSDIEGDKQAGRKSGPVVRGEDDVRLVFSGVALSLGGGYFLSVAFFATGLLIPAFVLATGAVAVAVTTLSSWSRGDKSRRRRPYRVFMLTQYGANMSVVIW